MSEIKFLYPQGKSKALTLSYDDGLEFDKRLVEILDKYNLKATFNVNSGIKPENFWVNEGIKIIRMDLKETIELFKNHEIAIHSLTHPPLEKLTRAEIVHEILEDRNNLENIYDCIITGMAYPFGSYNELVIDVLKELGVEYSRTVSEHETFDMPDNFLEWHPTCHHNNPNLMEFAKNFLEKESDDLDLLYIWGHSYDFEVDNNWEVIEEFSQLVSGKDSVWYATNIEICNYINALKQLKFTVDNSKIYNPTALDLWVKVDNKVLQVKGGELLEL